jgi:hypothetical protein
MSTRWRHEARFEFSDSTGSAQANNLVVCWQVARTLISATCRSSQPMATAVWDALCGSIPMITVISSSFVVG